MTHDLNLQPVIDLSVIQQLRQIDPDSRFSLVQRLINLYLESVENILQELQDDVRNADEEHFRILVHRFKTTNSNLGLKRMYDLLTQLEKTQFGKSEQAELLLRLKEESARAVAALEGI